jgi:sigma-B regulation protein RsbU (phosphoserine phosphatase)
MIEVQRQLQVLGALQRHLLPREIPQPPGWQIVGHYAVGRWPGGDYYDFLPFPDGRLLLLVADASDQGAPAAALVAMARVVLHSCPLSSGVERLPFCPFFQPLIQPPHVLLGHLNRILFENSLEEQYLTAFCGVLDPLDGTLHYANAGHPAPRWWRASSCMVESLRDAAGLPLGVDGKASYHHKRLVIEPGDMLLFYTDGLTAALNNQGQMFGWERLDETLREMAPDRAKAVKSSVLAQLDDFLDGKSPEDDVTLLIVERMS